MKVGNTKLMLIALMLSVVSMVRGTDSLTVGMVFNFNVGDTFEYKSYEYCICGMGGSTLYTYFAIKGYTVTGRTNLPDTIVYEMQCLNGGQLSQLVYSSLDSNLLVFNGNDQTIPFSCPQLQANMTCDTDAMWCNNSASNLGGIPTIKRENMFFESAKTYEVGMGIGLAYSRYNALEYFSGGGGSMGQQGGYVTKLVRYVSGGVQQYFDSSLYYTGIEGTAASSTTALVYPNPAQDKLSVRISELDDYVIDIKDINGRVVYSTTTSKELNTVNVSALKSGLYFLSITGMQHWPVASYRFVKE